MGLADDRKQVNLMTVHVSKSVTVHEVSNTIPEEHKTEDGKTKFIKDLFVKKIGDLESHKKWILKNSIFVLKDNNDTENKKEISIVEWLSLDTDERALYKDCLLYTSPSPRD